MIYNGLEASISSGAAGVLNQNIDRLQSVTIGYNIPRAKISTLGRFKTLDTQPVINYTPVSFSANYIKSDNSIESNIGFVNPTGIGIVFANTDATQIAGFGARNLVALVSPAQGNNFYGQMNVYSGAITSFSVSATINEPVKASFGGEGLDYNFTPNNAGRSVPEYTSQLIRSQDITLSGIDFSGFGFSGLTIQTFDLAINLGRQAAFQMGNRFPKRIPTEIAATLSIKGFFEGINNSFSGLSIYDCGTPYTGTMYFTLVPSCSANIPTTYAVVNPFIDSNSISAAIGNFVEVDFQFSIPISINSGEAATGSNLIIT